jgi:hypothetical protein
MPEKTRNARRTRTAPKSAETAPKLVSSGVRAAATPKSAKASAATRTRKANATAAKGKAAPGATRPAKPASKPATTTPRASGPTPARIVLAGKVAAARKRGDKWSEIAAALDTSESTLATLRKDVRAGKFAKVSPVASRVAADAF